MTVSLGVDEHFGLDSLTNYGMETVAFVHVFKRLIAVCKLVIIIIFDQFDHINLISKV